MMFEVVIKILVKQADEDKDDNQRKFDEYYSLGVNLSVSLTWQADSSQLLIIMH